MLAQHFSHPQLSLTLFVASQVLLIIGKTGDLQDALKHPGGPLKIT